MSSAHTWFLLKLHMYLNLSGLLLCAHAWFGLELHMYLNLSGLLRCAHAWFGLELRMYLNLSGLLRCGHAWFGLDTNMYSTVPEPVWIASQCACVVWFGTAYVPEPVWIAATEFSVHVLLEFPHVKNPRIGLHILKLLNDCPLL